MIGPDEAIEAMYPDIDKIDDMTEGQLADYMLEQGLFDDFDDCYCDYE